MSDAHDHLAAILAQLHAGSAAGLRPRVGVSACLLGAPVRYDGGHRDSAAVHALLGERLEAVPLCPEVAIGLGVPRPTLQVVRTAAGERVRGVDDPGRDVTDALVAYARQVLHGHRLHGYVFKTRSPSCAPGTVPLFDEAGHEVGRTWGLYARAIAREVPAVIDEETLVSDPEAARHFLQAVWDAAAREARGG